MDRYPASVSGRGTASSGRGLEISSAFMSAIVCPCGMHTQEEIVAAMSLIGTMVKGKVTVSRTAKSGRRYSSLQARHGGRNVMRYLAAGKIAAMDNYSTSR